MFRHWSPEAEKSEDTAGGGWQGVLQRNYSQDCSFKDNMYHVGDYVYVEPTEPNLQPHIVCIERLWQDDAGITSRNHAVNMCYAFMLFHNTIDWEYTLLLRFGEQ